MDKENLKKRIITGLILTAVVVGLLILGSIFCVGRQLMAIAALAAVAVCVLEYCMFPGRPDSSHSGTANAFEKVFTFALIFLPPLLVGVVFFKDICRADFAPELTLSLALLAFFVVSAFIVFWTAYGQQLSLEERAVKIRDLFIALILIGLGGAVFISLVALPAAPFAVAWLLLVVCGNDIVAYFAGQKVGGTRIAPVISPGKTVAGSGAGLLAGVVLGVLFWGMLPGVGLPTSWPVFWQAFLVSLLVVASAQAGDLLKSFLKRSHNIKDSGVLLPGHGGILDRMDAVFFASPVFYGLLMLVRHYSVAGL